METASGLMNCKVVLCFVLVSLSRLLWIWFWTQLLRGHCVNPSIFSLSDMDNHVLIKRNYTSNLYNGSELGFSEEVMNISKLNCMDNANEMIEENSFRSSRKLQRSSTEIRIQAHITSGIEDVQNLICLRVEEEITFVLPAIE